MFLIFILILDSSINMLRVNSPLSQSLLVYVACSKQLQRCLQPRPLYQDRVAIFLSPLFNKLSSQSFSSTTVRFTFSFCFINQELGFLLVCFIGCNLGVLVSSFNYRATSTVSSVLEENRRLNRFTKNLWLSGLLPSMLLLLVCLLAAMPLPHQLSKPIFCPGP